jgi:hypothetical protein
MNSKRKIIVDFSKLTPEILQLFMEEYPESYTPKNVITFKNAKNETVKAVEVITEDTVYLVKVSTKLDEAIENYLDLEDSDDDVSDDTFVDADSLKDVIEDEDDLDA